MKGRTQVVRRQKADFWKVMEKSWDINTGFDQIDFFLTIFFLPFLTVFDSFWPFSTVLTVVDRYWQLLTSIDSCWPFWTVLDRIDRCWPYLTIFDHFWPFLTVFDQFWRFWANITHVREVLPVWGIFFCWYYYRHKLEDSVSPVWEICLSKHISILQVASQASDWTYTCHQKAGHAGTTTWISYFYLISSCCWIYFKTLMRHCKHAHQSQSQNCKTFTSHICSLNT